MPPRNAERAAVDAASRGGRRWTRRRRRGRSWRGPAGAGAAGAAGAQARRVEHAGGAAGAAGARRRRARRARRRRTRRRDADRSESVPRHHGVSGSRSRPAARARVSACCSTSAKRRIRSASTWRPIANMSFWHSATFSNDGTKVLFSDEWGGGGAAALPRDRQDGVGRRRALHDREQQDGVPQLLQDAGRADRAQRTASRTTDRSIPIPGRDVMVQAWYQGGISVFDWTDAAHPKEIALLRSRTDRRARAWCSGGSWSAYWYNGVIVSSEIARGLDIFELRPERAHLAERDRRREDGAVRLPERAGAAEVRVAAELRAGARVSSISSSGRRACGPA